MAKYYCPYCSRENQVYYINKDGKMFCSICDDELTRERIVKPTQLISLLIAIAFVLPLLISSTTLFKELLEKRNKDTVIEISISNYTGYNYTTNL